MAFTGSTSAAIYEPDAETFRKECVNAASCTNFGARGWLREAKENQQKTSSLMRYFPGLPNRNTKSSFTKNLRTS
jgi:hypothetical protein